LFDYAIQNRDITTWRRVAHGKVFWYTHKDKERQWADKALLQPIPENGELAFYAKLVSPDVRLTRAVYAFYAGHLAETFIKVPELL
jgi:hypothetical protein